MDDGIYGAAELLSRASNHMTSRSPRSIKKSIKKDGQEKHQEGQLFVILACFDLVLKQAVEITFVN